MHFVDSEVLNNPLKPLEDKIATSVITDMVCTHLDLDEKFHSPFLATGKGQKERIALLTKTFQSIPVHELVLEKYRKNSNNARALRERGNAKYKLRMFESALESYNLAIMFAETGSEELGKAFANRSAVCTEMEDPEGALADIELSLQNGYPASAVSRLHERRKKCENMINSRDSSKSPGQVAAGREKQERNQFREEMFRLQERNPLLPAAADFVEIKVDESMGRGLFANRDIPPGTVVMVENPYSSVLDDSAKWNTNHCHFCLKRTSRLIPCEGCVFAMYCGEDCKSRAEEEYHKYECNCMSSFHVNQTTEFPILALRVICKVGPEELFRIFSTKDADYDRSQEPFVPTPENIYDSSSYKTVFHLESHPEHRMNWECLCNAYEALVITSLLEERTTFFNAVPEEAKAGFKNFVATHILHQIESIRLNSAAIADFLGPKESLAEFYEDARDSDADSPQLSLNALECENTGRGIYPAFTLLNHSCAPNVFRINDVKTGRITMVTQRTVRAGEQLLTYYSMKFTTHELKERQEALKYLYHFDCKCVACINKWPVRPGKDATEHNGFCCPDCSKRFSLEERASLHPEFKKCCLKEPTWKCDLCGKSYCKQMLENLFEEKEQEWESSLDLFRCNRLREAAQKMKELSDYLQFHLVPPCSRQYAIESFFFQCVALMFYYSQ